MKVDSQRVLEAVMNDEMVGFCLACGDERENTEPDARRYLCRACGRPSVYGSEEVLVMVDAGAL